MKSSINLLSLLDCHYDNRFIVFNCLEHGLLSGHATLSKNLKDYVEDFDVSHFYTTA